MSSYLHVRVVEATGLPPCYSYFKAQLRNINVNDSSLVWKGKSVKKHKTSDPLWNESHTFKISKNYLETGSLVIEVYQKGRKSRKLSDKYLGECKIDLTYFGENQQKQYSAWLPIRDVRANVRSKKARRHSANNSQNLDEDTMPSLLTLFKKPLFFFFFVLDINISGQEGDEMAPNQSSSSNSNSNNKLQAMSDNEDEEMEEEDGTEDEAEEEEEEEEEEANRKNSSSASDDIENVIIKSPLNINTSVQVAKPLLVRDVVAPGNTTDKNSRYNYGQFSPLQRPTVPDNSVPSKVSQKPTESQLFKKKKKKNIHHLINVTIGERG
ncbi:hypothetical protein RFI_15429 [Reticulomyxa filosa]|uniref:C2 domain-containing protein n=1 Tax=Reticulomyxa filosa TaxID=46433 RepID=X6N779_RETFI|nr:hypothetical protein RFI_15429 [Reticulomyxa filosa]|eukprot:ETO21773.1 hypothetical protein RFI_15429 [Reticulomyxa filosa]